MFPVGVWVLCFAIYFICMPKTLSWGLNDYGIDSPEFLTSAMVSSNPHPPGYPFYSLLLRAFIEIVPFGDSAFRGNLLSVLISCCTASLVYVLILKITQLCFKDSGISLAHISSAIFGVSVYIFCPLVWGTSLITEVYSLNGFLCVLLLLIFAHTIQKGSRSIVYSVNLLRVFFLLCGLALANHLTILAIAVPLIVALLLFYRNNVGTFLTSCLFIVPGLLFYLYLPIRSVDPHPISWGNPQNLEGFLWMLKGGPYGAYLTDLTVISIGDRMMWGLNTLYTFINPLTLMFVASGFIHLWERNRYLFTVLLVSASGFFVYAILYRTIDAEVNALPTIIISSIMSGFGIFCTLRLIKEIKFPPLIINKYTLIKDSFRALSGLFFLFSFIVIFFPFPSNYNDIIAANNDRALMRGKELISSSSHKGIIFLTNEHDVFPSWYVNYVEYPNPHAVPVAIPLLQYEWYWENTIQKATGTDIPFEPDLVTAIKRIYEFNRGLKEVFLLDRSIVSKFRTEPAGILFKITGVEQ